jgi:hypothetical protein
LAFTVAATQVKTQDFNLVLMSESVLIILSMVVPTILFRLMLPKTETDEALAQDIRQVREQMIQRGIDHLDDLPELSDEFKQAVTFDLKSQDGHTTVQQFVSEWRRMVRHPEYTQAEMNLLIATYQRVFKTERQYLIDLYYTQHEVSEELFNSLYREVAMAELMVLDYGSRN